jgi:superfamily I DNA/RNA helicase
MHQNPGSIGSHRKALQSWRPLDTYGKLLNAEGAIDFADLMLKAVRDMHSKSMPPLSVRWLLVDEAQDMDDTDRMGQNSRKTRD